MNVQAAFHRMLRQIKVIRRKGVDAIEMPPLDDIAVIGAWEQGGGIFANDFLKFLMMGNLILSCRVQLLYFHRCDAVVMRSWIVPAIDIVVCIVGAHLDIVMNNARRRQANLVVPLSSLGVECDEKRSRCVARAAFGWHGRNL